MLVVVAKNAEYVNNRPLLLELTPPTVFELDLLYFVDS
jgi:hypothetical protein